MTDFSPWIRHTLLGPFISCFGLVTLLHFTFGEQILFSAFSLDSWLLTMMLIGFFAAGMVVNLIVADVLLLKFKRYMLPTGPVGWATSMGAPLGVLFVWNTFGTDGASMLEVVIRTVGPMIFAAHVARAIIGRRPG